MHSIKERARLLAIADMLGHSVWSLALPSAIVCHCMFHGASAPPRFRRHELLPGLRAAGDPPVAVPRADCAIIRRMAVPASAVIEPAALPGTTIIPAGTLDDRSWLKPRWRSIATTHSLGSSS